MMRAEFHHARILIVIVAVLLSLSISGCAPTQLAVTAIKHAKKEIEKPKVSPSKKVEEQKIVPIGPGGTYKVGNPYTINGVTYKPTEDPDYNKTGIASWYGKDFHGKRTANGEIYDMNALTAAHKTLPLPTYVQVPNLDNGRSLVVRVNDRGPFVNNRIIDMSRRGAQLLGFQRQGTAKVRVRVIASSKDGFIANKPNTTAEERAAVVAAPINSVEKIKLEPPEDTQHSAKKVPTNKRPAVVALQPLESNIIFIQVGSFKLYENANRLGAILSPYGPVIITSVIVKKEEFFRVRIGPLSDVEVADKTLNLVINGGHTGAHIVIN